MSAEKYRCNVDKNGQKVSSIPRSILLYESIVDTDISKVSSIVSISIFHINNPGFLYTYGANAKNIHWAIKRIYWSHVLAAGSFTYGGYLWYLGVGLSPQVLLVLAPGLFPVSSARRSRKPGRQTFLMHI